MLEIRGEHPLPHARFDFRREPKTPLGDLVGLKLERPIMERAKRAHQFGLERGTPEILALKTERLGRHTQLLDHLAAHSLLRRLAGLEMPAHGRIPFAGLNVLSIRSLLEEQITPAVENQDMNRLVNQDWIAMALAARSPSGYTPRLIDNLEPFLHPAPLTH